MPNDLDYAERQPAAETGSSPAGGHPQDFIFARELSEVYLLLDHISGRADRQLPGESIAEICEIGWPPRGNSSERARQAATLLIAKDRLNYAACPANGATIAFSLLVVGGDTETAGVREMHRQPSGGHKDPGWDEPPTRISLAKTAFPGLVGSAASFRRWMKRIIYAMLVWLAFTCLLSWDVATGRAVLSRLDALARAQADITAKISAADLEEDRGQRMAGGMPAAVNAGPDAPIGIKPYCKRHGAGTSADPGRFDSIAALRVCEPLDQNTEAKRVAYANLADWIIGWNLVVKGVPYLLCGGTCLDTGMGEKALTQNGTDEQFGSILVEVLSNAVLPVCYGILGAAASIVRELWRKIRDSLLSPRDLTLSLGQLALGAVIGGCIGLFVTPSGGSAGSASTSLIGMVTLSASALSFIAGFGVEGVFLALEGFIRRVFNLK